MQSGGTESQMYAAGASSGPPVKPRSKHVVHWFRRGLRLHDQPALREGLVGAKTFRCVFILDSHSASTAGLNKWRFLLECLEDLDVSLRKLNSRLFVIRGQPADVFPKLFKQWRTTHLTFEEDPEPYGVIRDRNITSMAVEMGLEVISKPSHTLYQLEIIAQTNGGSPPITYKQFLNVLANVGEPPKPVPRIAAEDMKESRTLRWNDHDDKYGVPTLVQLGFPAQIPPQPSLWLGGETEGLRRLERNVQRSVWMSNYDPTTTKLNAESLAADSIGLSPYLRFGCLSVRYVYHQMGMQIQPNANANQTMVTLFEQLIWREFFYSASNQNPTFDRMVGNPMCLQIPWDKNDIALAKWAQGETGYPWIDAIMRQLRNEGWIHPIARHATACFLTRGYMWISWEAGMKVFDELLIDADWSLNAGQWMWLSCSSGFHNFHHIYCPVRFGKKIDPNGDYIRRYVGVLQQMPTTYVHEPWLAPKHVQTAANCILGKDYPLPILDYKKAASLNQQRMRQVYSRLQHFRSFNADVLPFSEASSQYSQDSDVSKQHQLDVL